MTATAKVIGQSVIICVLVIVAACLCIADQRDAAALAAGAAFFVWLML